MALPATRWVCAPRASELRPRARRSGRCVRVLFGSRAQASSDDAADGGSSASARSDDSGVSSWGSSVGSEAPGAGASAERLRAWRADVEVYAPPRFNLAPFAPAYAPPPPPPVRERTDKPRPRARGGASAGRAAASALVCAACAVAVNAAVFDAALPWTHAALGGADLAAATLPMLAAHDTAQAVLAAAGTMLLALYGVYALGLTAYAARRLVTRGEPVIWHRCDGGDPQCCANKPAQAYLSHGRGFETENARAMAGHLRWRKGCRLAPPLIVRLAPDEEPLW